MPAQFWGLTVREFNLKHQAFMRAEDRQRALLFEHGLMVGHVQEKNRTDVHRVINQLRRYPIKSWLR